MSLLHLTVLARQMEIDQKDACLLLVGHEMSMDMGTDSLNGMLMENGH